MVAKRHVMTMGERWLEGQMLDGSTIAPSYAGLACSAQGDPLQKSNIAAAFEFITQHHSFTNASKPSQPSSQTGATQKYRAKLMRRHYGHHWSDGDGALRMRVLYDSKSNAG